MNAGQPNVNAACDLVGAVVGSAEAAGLPTLEGVDWHVLSGDYWVLAAWTGSGKSDLLATIAGLQRPLAGRVLVLGRDLYRLDSAGLIEHRRQVGFVFGEGGRLFNDLTLAENIALPVAYHTNRSVSEVLPELEPLLALTELADFADRFPPQTGRVWQQRVALARALAMKPALLLLSNPIAGFDARHVGWWRELLAQLNAGHPWLENRALTLMVTAEDLRPWTGHGKQFAMIYDRQLSAYRSEEEFTADHGGFLREGFDAEKTNALPQAAAEARPA